MRQVVQPIDGRATEVWELDPPACGPGQVLIANRFSVLSPGTERSTVELAKKSLVGKARSRPDHVRRVLEKVRREGVASTIRQVRAKLAQPMPLGYSSAGVVLEVGDGVGEFKVGDRVASNGSHAGVVAVGRHLVAKVPDAVPLEEAAYAVLASISLQGVRLAQVGLADVVGVVGLGPIGLIAVALLRSAGCVVIATDPQPARRQLALEMGATEVADEPGFERRIASRTGGQGADALLLTASTASNGPLELAARVARRKAKLVAVGAIGMEVPRREFYPKELELVVSCSYGPGRYDADYEDRGVDYPYEFVRWTEQRNIQAVLDLMADGELPFSKLTSRRFPIEAATEAYSLLETGTDALGIVLEYPEAESTRPPAWRRVGTKAQSRPGTIGVTLLGAGAFANSMLAPLIAQWKDVRLRGVISGGGLSAESLRRRFGFDYAGTDAGEAFADPETDVVVIATRHHLHAPLGLSALRAGKSVFLEKPLAIDSDQLDEWRLAIAEMGVDCPLWTVGFNRRFSPPARMLRETFADVEEPKVLVLRFDAGRLPADHWTLDPEIGGGRIIGEACHAIDLATYLLGSPPIKVCAESIAADRRRFVSDENVSITLRHADGSVVTIVYVANGEPAAGKERIEMFGGGTTASLDDFRSLTVHRHGRRILRRRWSSTTKGHAEELATFRRCLADGSVPITYEELIATTAASHRAVESLRLELPLEVD